MVLALAAHDKALRIRPDTLRGRFRCYALRIERLEGELADQRANVQILRAPLSAATMMALRVAE